MGMTEISGAAAESLIQSQIDAHRGGIQNALAPFEPTGTFFAWLDTIRAIEELINLPTFAVDDPSLERRIIGLRLDPFDPVALGSIVRDLTSSFSEGVANRFRSTALQAAAIGMAFRQHGLFEPAAGMQSVAHAIGYFQSRRRHLVALLYSIPAACTGTRSMPRLDTLNQLLPQVEHSGLTITGLYQKLMLAKVFADFRLIVDAHGFSANHDYEFLDAMYLEPERAGILEVRGSAAQNDSPAQLEPVDPRLIFSAAELRNDIRLLEAAYAEFDLAGTSFGQLARFVRSCLDDCEDDYLVKLSRERFDRLLDDAALPAAMRAQLLHHGGDYVANTDVVAPFIVLGELRVATVTLLSRFLYYWKTASLNRIRRFQIRSGYIFEDSVKIALKRQGFGVTDVKRINRKEFDVVALLNGVIYNIQCKNNLVDLTRIESDAARFARYNRQLDRYYSAALGKEEAREALLLERFGLSEVRHFVLSRFPIATVNPRVIAYSRIDEFRALATR